ncbi:MAG: cryptochrome/photolyase family protein [Hyphomicrobiales bacterium]
MRLADNLAFSAAARAGGNLVCVYILDDNSPGHHKMGGAQRWWLHKSLENLCEKLNGLGMPLVLRLGSADEVLKQLISETGAGGVYFTRQIEPWAMDLEERVHRICQQTAIECHRYPGQLLFEPEAVLSPVGTPYKVYTPFSKRCFSAPEPKRPLPAPDRLEPFAGAVASEDITSWGLLPENPNWAEEFGGTWQPGEDGARAQLTGFLENALGRYGADRDFPGIEGTSRLSPHLHFGEISPAQCWHATAHALGEGEGALDVSGDKFLKELLWREFAQHLLFHWPDLPENPLRGEFAAFPWAVDDAAFKTWTRGQTGYPIVDAGMRQLWRTGWMHNRVRMIAASFLIKNLLIDWRRGSAWFHDTLVDADLASNSASWQWVAGCGTDAAPFFRIFNPILQGEKFDPDGTFVRKFVPELSGVPLDFLHKPWQAPPEILRQSGVILGETYPHPIVDHFVARDKALSALKTIAKSA